jgi:hypothetical protein
MRGYGFYFGLVVGAHVEVAADVGVGDLADDAGLDDLVDGVDEVGRAAALEADLHDAVVLAGGGEHGFAFAHVGADGLLDVDVRAGLAGGDHRQGVPVVGGADEDDVQVLFLEHLAVVAVKAGVLLLALLAGHDEVGGFFKDLLVHVAEADDVDGGDLHEAEEVVLSVPARADQAGAEGFLICAGDVGGEGAESKAGGGGFEKLAAVDGIHRDPPWGCICRGV